MIQLQDINESWVDPMGKRAIKVTREKEITLRLSYQNNSAYTFTYKDEGVAKEDAERIATWTPSK